MSSAVRQRRLAIEVRRSAVIELSGGRAPCGLRMSYGMCAVVSPVRAGRSFRVRLRVLGGRWSVRGVSPWPCIPSRGRGGSSPPPPFNEQSSRTRAIGRGRIRFSTIRSRGLPAVGRACGVRCAGRVAGTPTYTQYTERPVPSNHSRIVDRRANPRTHISGSHLILKVKCRQHAAPSAAGGLARTRRCALHRRRRGAPSAAASCV